REARLQDPRGAGREGADHGRHRRAGGERRHGRSAHRGSERAGRWTRGVHRTRRGGRAHARRGVIAKVEEKGRGDNQSQPREIRVIDADGGQLGVMTPLDAQRIADQKELDLVEVAPTANPPVCRIMDYGKYRYAQKKKAQESRKKVAASQLKEVK